jgi:CheY-like chemotaxis protein
MRKDIHVLVVEDTFIAQQVIKMQLEQQGCKVDIATNGCSALEMATKTKYDLILMDIGLGEGVDGFETTTQIKKKSPLNKKTPIIALTAHNEFNYKEKSFACGMVDYFNKPFTRHEAEILVEDIRRNLFF